MIHLAYTSLIFFCSHEQKGRKSVTHHARRISAFYSNLKKVEATTAENAD